MPLDELGAALNVGYGGSLGKHTNSLVSRMVGSKLPGGFGLSNVKAHLGKQWGLGPGRTDGALLVALTMEPPKRLGTEAEAKAFLDTVAQTYAQSAGISLSTGPAAGSGGGGGAVAIDRKSQLPCIILAILTMLEQPRLSKLSLANKRSSLLSKLKPSCASWAATLAKASVFATPRRTRLLLSKTSSMQFRENTARTMSTVSSLFSSPSRLDTLTPRSTGSAKMLCACSTTSCLSSYSLLLV